MANETDILALEDDRYGAMLKGDVSALEALLDDELVYTDSSGRIDTKTQYLDSFKVGLRKYRNIERRNLQVIIRGNAALVFCELHIQASLRDAPRNVRTKALAVWTKTGDKWRLLALQSTAHGG